ncbi:MAG: late competence development ComFB family protein [Spirochaetia bacterium]
MKIHNQMEDTVLKMVHEIFTEEENNPRMGVCTCSQCRMDVACYVLNRVTPEYIISGRGVAHLDSDYNQKLQKEADLVSLIKEGIGQVNSTKRPHFTHSPHNEPQDNKAGLFFNFPTIIGRLFNGINFEPVFGLKVYLRQNGENVKMLDPNWQNPYNTVKNTAGTYIFWPHPLHAEEPGITKTFEFEISIESKGYEPIHHFISVESRSEPYFLESFHMQRSYKVEDLYIFPE